MGGNNAYKSTVHTHRWLKKICENFLLWFFGLHDNFCPVLMPGKKQKLWRLHFEPVIDHAERITQN